MRNATERIVFETALGYTSLARRDGRVSALSFGHPSERAAVQALFLALREDPSSAESDAEVEWVSPGEDPWVDRLRAYADGEPGNFDDLQVAVEHLTPFARKVMVACRKIPSGETLTYGEVAQQAGSPGAARAVGRVMSQNRVPLIVPCHRVVPASGGLGGFSAPQGVAMKKRLLELEQRTSELLLR